MPNTDPDSFPKSIPRTSSEPNISKTKHHHPPPSTRSSTTRRKGGKSSARAWKLSSKDSDLTEEKLQKYNQRNASNDKKNSTCSPYYKGLTDSTLYITRQRLAGLSPGRESQGTAVTSSSISTVLVRLQEWSTSCFKGKVDSRVSMSTSTSTRTSSTSLFSSSSSTAMKEAKEIWLKNTEVSSIDSKISRFEKKPLRERVSAAVVATAPATATATAPAPATATAPPPVQVTKRVIVVGGEKPKEGRMNNKEREFVWANEYRPRALKEFICNRDKAEQLHALVRKGQCSHYIFEGPPGVGKRTMVWALLREVFGPEKLRTREECKVFELKGEFEASIKVNVKVSSQHIEINLSELYGYEKHVIVALLKETQVLNTEMQCDHTNCRAIILYEADKLSADAQLYIRWLIERSKGCTKIFFCCTDVSKLQPIKPLCTIIQLLPPSNKEIVEVLEFIAEKEDIQLPHQLAERIAEKSKHNLRQAIRSFEASWQLNYPFKEDQVIITGWEDDIAKIAKNIIEEQSPRQLYVIRGKLQNLIEHSVSPAFIFSTLVQELKKHLCEEFQTKLDVLYQEYNRDSAGNSEEEKSLVLLRSRYEESGKRNNDLRKNVQHFMRIEEFTAKFMSFYKSCMMKSIGGPNGYASERDSGSRM